MEGKDWISVAVFFHKISNNPYSCLVCRYVNELELFTLGENEFSLSFLSAPHDKCEPRRARVESKLWNTFRSPPQEQPVNLEIWKYDSLLNPRQFNEE